MPRPLTSPPSTATGNPHDQQPDSERNCVGI
jgi:hypothetical protein